MDMGWGAIAAAAIGGIFGSAQASSANATNRKMQERAHKFSADESNKGRVFATAQLDKSMAYNSAEAVSQRDWEEKMRSSQYQTAIGDMKASGINPMLAISQGGAGTPSSSAASVSANSAPNASGVTTPQVGKYGNKWQDLLDAAGKVVDIKNAEKAGQLIDANRGKVIAETGNVEQQTETGAASAGQLHASADVLRKQIDKMSAEITELETRSKEQLSGADLKRQLEETARSQAYLNDALRELKTGEAGLIPARKKVIEADATLKGYAIPKARNEAKAQEDWYMEKVAPYTSEMGKLGNLWQAIRRGR